MPTNQDWNLYEIMKQQFSSCFMEVPVLYFLWMLSSSLDSVTPLLPIKSYLPQSRSGMYSSDTVVFIQRESHGNHLLQSTPGNKQWKKWMKILSAVNVTSGDVPAGDLYLSISLAQLPSKSQCWTTVCEEIHCTDMKDFKCY